MLYYSFTKQTQRVSSAMAEVFQEQGWEVTECPIEFVDEKYKIEFPFKPFWPKLLRWLWPQATGKTGQVRIPSEISEAEYDLICIGSPTWWLNPAMPVVSFLKTDEAGKLLNGKRFAVFTVCRKVWWNNMRRVKKLARKQGGTFVDGATFRFRGGQIQSALAFINYMQTETNRDRYMGIRIYDFGIPDDGIESAKHFAGKLAASNGE